MPPITSTYDTAEFFNVDVKTLRSWANDAGCPKEGRGKWDLKAVFLWWCTNKAPGAESGSDAIRKTKEAYWHYMAEDKRINVEERLKNLIDKSLVVAEWAGRAAEFKTGLFFLVTALPPLLEGKNQMEMREIIENQVWKLLDKVYRSGRFCPEKAVKKRKRRE